jgi:hypothetical protein
MNIAAIKATYGNNSSNSKAKVSYSKIKATEKWVEHSINLHMMQKLMLTSDREERYVLLNCIKKAESKLNYYYRHPNYNAKIALGLFKEAKRLIKLAK